MKFMVGDKLVIVYGKEDFGISELSSFPYMEAGKGITKIPFHYLDFEHINSAFINQSQSTVVVLSSVKSAKESLEMGPFSG